MLSPSWCHRQAGGASAVSAKEAEDISEIPAIPRFREGPRLCAKSAEGMYPESPKVGGAVSWIVTATLSRKPSQSNRNGGSGCYPRVRGDNLWRIGGNGGGPIIEGLWQVVDRGFGGNGRMVTVAVERSRVGIARRAPAGRRGTEPGGSVKTRRIGRGLGLRR